MYVCYDYIYKNKIKAYNIIIYNNLVRDSFSHNNKLSLKI